MHKNLDDSLTAFGRAAELLQRARRARRSRLTRLLGPSLSNTACAVEQLILNGVTAPAAASDGKSLDVIENLGFSEQAGTSPEASDAAPAMRGRT